MPSGGFRKLPRVRDYLLDIKIFDQLEGVVARHKLPPERLEELLDLSDAVINDQVKVDQIPEFIEKAFGVDATKAKAIAADVVGFRLLPLSAFIKGIEDSIKAWGGDVANYPELRIEKPGLQDELLEYAREIGLELPENLMKRFIYLSKGYIEKERDRESTLTLMKRPMNIGGLELNDKQIEKLLAVLDERFGGGKDAEPRTQTTEPSRKNQEKGGAAPLIPKEGQGVVASDQEISDSIESEEPKQSKPPVPKVPRIRPEPKKPEPVERPKLESKPEKATRKRETLPIKAVPHALTTDVPVISGHLFEHEEAEVKAHAKDLQKKGLYENKTHDQKLLKVVDSATEKLSLIFKSAKQSQKSARSVAEAFVRGRLNEQRADALLQDKYGMSAEQSHETILILKKGYAELHKPQKEKLVKPKVDVKKQEKTVLDERHAALTSSVPTESIEPVLPKARVSAARSKKEELEGQRARVDKEKVKQAQEKARPQKAKIRLSAPSAPPKRQAEPSVKVADVKKVSKLIGPIEELGTMGVAEFRRLSSDPKEATNKMINTLELLEETDYEDRVRGIQAWRKSPLNNLYIALVQEALTKGMTVADAATQRRNTGEESLSAAEIEAIVTFNNKISF